MAFDPVTQIGGIVEPARRARSDSELQFGEQSRRLLDLVDERGPKFRPQGQRRFPVGKRPGLGVVEEEVEERPRMARAAEPLPERRFAALPRTNENPNGQSPMRLEKMLKISLKLHGWLFYAGSDK